jgi:hypothetical protein
VEEGAQAVDRSNFSSSIHVYEWVGGSRRSHALGGGAQLIAGMPYLRVAASEVLACHVVQPIWLLIWLQLCTTSF